MRLDKNDLSYNGLRFNGVHCAPSLIRRIYRFDLLSHVFVDQGVESKVESFSLHVGHERF